MPVVLAENLCKTYRVADKKPGLLGTLRHFVNRQYREIEAVRDVNLRIEPGEIVGFLGPNGAGKTTAIKMLTGLLHPSRGTAEVLGFRPFDRKHDFLRQMTLVMGNKQQLIWDLPTLDSLRINAAVYGLTQDEADRRTDELAEMLSLKEELTQPVRKLSLGQRMKCELVAALLHHPKVLFLDEPTLGLDVNAQTAVRAFLRDYNEKHGAAMLITSHYMADITALCERVVVIHKGELQYDGQLDAVVKRFAPYREVKVEFETPIDAAALEPFGEVQSTEGCAARLLAHRDGLANAMAQLLDQFDVVDLTVADPPIEEVIGRLFEESETPAETPG